MKVRGRNQLLRRCCDRFFNVGKEGGEFLLGKSASSGWSGDQDVQYCWAHSSNRVLLHRPLLWVYACQARPWPYGNGLSANFSEWR